MIYIAGPFFNHDQLNAIKDIEAACEGFVLKYFSPRIEGGILKDMNAEDRKAASGSVYDMNVDGIDGSDAVIAIIDDFDPGTMFELGYAAKARKTIITISNHNYGLNVMLAKPVRYHTGSATDAVNAYLGNEFEELKPEVTT